ncbi:DNA mismatch repair endonuclease MutL [Alkalinema sp. FACHB-956]|uniref:DNA mismatch repair endonuclease MutL n=1 Tax=Alkalinema sp. FACHB-956 TaxID=2692768 RepID=UPI001688EA61|nr:DNA mismatch repair endonuclease MutL [Alkalinema sp. FACHB-956]
MIRSLPSDVINLIAAGEVIDSLAAVVRELAENAIDAGATRITITLWPEQWRVRVADNGRGMALADLQQAAAPHSTSKIHDRDDLGQIQTLGFRGEALHSLAQLSRLEILSCPAETNQDTSQGHRVLYDGLGQVQQGEAIAIAPGTIVTIEDLFGNWPARRQSLPILSQQLRTIQQTIYHIALSHPHITWQVYQGDREWITLWSGKNFQTMLPQILPQIRPEDLRYTCQQITELPEDDNASDSLTVGDRDAVALAPELPDSSPKVISVELLLGLPDRCHRHRPDWMKVAINGRFVKSPELENTLFASLRRTVPRDRYPICLVHLHVPAQWIDWNRHPAKEEIYLQHLEQCQQWVNQAIEQVLKLDGENTSASSRTQGVMKAAELAGNYAVNRRVNLTESGPNTLNLKAIAQVHNMYILAEHATGLWLIEQHIAHERVLFEQLCDRWQLVDLEPPVILKQLTIGQVEQLQHIGMMVEEFGEDLWAVRHAPALLSERDDLADALWELSLGSSLETAQVATACRSAIRNGMPLTLVEMQMLINQWQQTRNPNTCPHGRPIYLSLEESALSRFFRRHWVIGKSHGL